MKTDIKHYKLINSQTGNTIFYCSLSTELKEEELKSELEKVRSQVATQNTIPVSVVYWEEVRS